jgi:hypothetical protein
MNMQRTHHSDSPVKARIIFDCSSTGIVGSNPIWGMMYAFCPVSFEALYVPISKTKNKKSYKLSVKSEILILKWKRPERLIRQGYRKRRICNGLGLVVLLIDFPACFRQIV